MSHILFFRPFAWVLLLCLPAVAGAAVGPTLQYPVATIPATLKENATAVIRLHETVFTVKTVSSSTTKVKYAVTILNERARDQARVVIYYDQNTKVHYLKGAVYDGEGTQVKKLKTADVMDQVVFSGSVHDDNRVKHVLLTHHQFPYTVEFEYETSTTVSLFYPTWAPQSEEHQAVEAASFEVLTPTNLALRYKEMNMSQPGATTEQGSLKKYKWAVKQLPALESEPFHPPYFELVPMVYTAPADFVYGSYKGSMQDWKSFGQWINQLNANRDQLPAATVAKLQHLTAAEKDDFAKVKKVYEYMQANTRYVSIQLGIGGFQPFEASFVDTKGYGDCKALSNYTMAMLQAVGIKSHYTLIRAGRNTPDLQLDFPSSQFNHAVLCVPLQGDTVWLECTSQTEAAGYAGSFTGGRHALLITPEGGKVVRSPYYQADDNVQRRKAVVNLNTKGDATAQVTTVYTGLQQDRLSQYLEQSPEEQKKWLYKQIELPSFEINKFTFSREKNRIPAITESLTLTAPRYVAQSGKRVFLNANFMNHITWVPPKNENRKVDIVTNMASYDTDTIEYRLPEGFMQVEFAPEDQKFSSRFGDYTATVKVDGNNITYIRTLRMHQGRFPASAYPELLDFYKKMVKADKVQVVLVNKT